RFSSHFGFIRSYLEGRTATPGAPPPADGGNPVGTQITPGRPVEFSVGPVTGATLYSGANSFRVEVPQGATRMEIKIASAGQVGFLVRKDQPPAVVGGRAQGDYTSPGNTGNETLVVNSGSTPPLQAGTYYIGVALFTTGQQVSATLTVDIGTGGNTTPPPGNPPPTGTGPGELQPGVRTSFSIPAVTAATLFRGQQGFRVTVPQGATTLQIALQTQTSSADLDLFVRFGQDVGLESGQVRADFTADGPTGNESITITSTGSTPLRAGVYYIALGVFTPNVAITGNLLATIAGGSTTPPPTTPPPAGTPPAGAGTQLISGQPRTFQTDPLSVPTLINGANGYYVQVPDGARRLEIKLATVTAGTDVDLLVRRGASPSAIGGKLEADFNSSGPDGNEVITITASSTPPLAPGAYYVALAVFTKNKAVQGTLTATVDTGTTPPAGGSSNALRSGTPARLDIPAANSAVLLTGAQGFTIQVEPGTTRLEVNLAAANPDHDIDLFIRRDSAPAVQNGKVIADASSEGNSGRETIVITSDSRPALQAGTYYIAIGVFVTGTPVTATLTATASGGGSTNPPPPADQGDPRSLTSGQARSFSFSSVSQPTLANGEAGFYVDVPENAARLDVKLETATAGADLDLFVRFKDDIGLNGGRVQADHVSEGPAGSEAITITRTSTPPLRAGRYFVGIGVFTTGVPVSGTVSAVLVRADGGGAPAGSSVLVPGQRTKFTLPAVDNTTLFTGDFGYTLVVPESASSVKISLAAETPNADLDLYVRRGEPVSLVEGRPVADHTGESERGDETIIITGSSTPPLQPGTYYIGFGAYTTGTPITATITAEIQRESIVPPLSSAQTLTFNTPTPFTLPAVRGATLFSGEAGFRVSVPAGASTLEIQLQSVDPLHDMDLFVRFGKETEIVEGRPVADYASNGDTGNETIQIPNPRPGEYFVNLGLFTTGTQVSGRVTARLTRAGSQMQEQSGLHKLTELEGKQQEQSTELPAGSTTLQPKQTGTWQSLISGGKAELQSTQNKQIVVEFEPQLRPADKRLGEAKQVR
ncbi:MAG: PPC domain-containing protein, partial [Bryobacteraceae bacterium]|nr:PPC domain-containing protein [Bryobacteraceae bacterium]